MIKKTYLSRADWARLIVKAWAEPSFKDELEQDPTAAIKAYAKDELGIEVERPLQIPPAPADLIEEGLDPLGGVHRPIVSVQLCLTANLISPGHHHHHHEHT